MKNLKIVSMKGEVIGDFELPKTFDSVEAVNSQAVFDSVLAEQQSQRQGTHSTKTKAEVSGGGRKPFKQKHTGNARQGSRRNPHFVGGGVVFGPKPNRNYLVGVNRKVHRLAYFSTLCNLFKENKMTILENKALLDETPSARAVIDLLSSLKLIDKKVLLVVNESSVNLLVSARNLKKVIVKPASKVSVRDLLNNKHVLIQQDGLKQILGAWA